MLLLLLLAPLLLLPPLLLRDNVPRRVAVTDGQRLLVRAMGYMSRPHAMAARDHRMRASAGIAHKPTASAAQGLAAAEETDVARSLACVLLVGHAAARADSRLHAARGDVAAVAV